MVNRDRVTRTSGPLQIVQSNSFIFLPRPTRIFLQFLTSKIIGLFFFFSPRYEQFSHLKRTIEKEMEKEGIIRRAEKCVVNNRVNLLRGLGGSSTSCVVTCVGRPTVVTSSCVYARFSWPERLVAWLSRACSFFDPRNDRLSISCLSSSSFRLRSCSYTIKSSVYLSSFND